MEQHFLCFCIVHCMHMWTLPIGNSGQENAIKRSTGKKKGVNMEVNNVLNNKPCKCLMRKNLVDTANAFWWETQNINIHCSFTRKFHRAPLIMWNLHFVIWTNHIIYSDVHLYQWSSIGGPRAASSLPASYLWPPNCYSFTMCFGWVGTCIPRLVSNDCQRYTDSQVTRCCKHNI